MCNPQGDSCRRFERPSPGTRAAGAALQPRTRGRLRHPPSGPQSFVTLSYPSEQRCGMGFHWWKFGSRRRPRTVRGPSASRPTAGRLTLTRLEDRSMPDAVPLSLAASGTVTPNGDSSQPSVSTNGQFVVFSSAGTNLVAGETDTNAALD